MFTLTPVADLVETLNAAEIRAHTDAAKVALPGVWVQPTAFELDTLSTTRVPVRLVLIVGDTDDQRALEALLVLLNQLRAVLPVTSAALRTVLMPDGSRHSGLEVPFSVRAEIPQE